MSCRLPGGADRPERFWEVLAGGRDCLSDVPLDRWNHANYYHPHPDAPGRTVARQAGFLESVYDFDAGFFGISPREAESMDPQQRLLLELACESLERAGCPLHAVAGSSTGVFIGLSSYDVVLHADSFGWATHAATGASPALISNRISYILDLHGPSFTLDSACSASLSALDAACRSLATGQCRQALVGSVNLLLDPAFFLAFSRLHMLSPHNRCSTFDAAADGYARGEGGVMFVLKTLSQALQDGDRVEAVVLATGLNQDGRTAGITAPAQAAQVALLGQLYDYRPYFERLAYVETHGTGTPLGDPTEARSIAQVFQPTKKLWIGSAKTNIGHLEGAAGAVGLLKAILCLQRGQIPPSLHFTRPPCGLDLEALGLSVPTRAVDLPAGSIVGVNSFGFGGTNGHAIVGEAPQAPATPAAEQAHYVLPLSAACPQALRERVRQYQRWLAAGESPRLADLIYSQACCSSQHGYRAALVGRDASQLAVGLQDWLNSGQARQAAPNCRPVLVFCGQGPQWWGMGRELLQQQPVFRDVIEACDRQLQELGGWSLLHLLQESQASGRLDQTAFAQPAIFAVQAGLYQLWRSWGLEPAAVVGHSVGEIAAAYAAGILTLGQALEVVFQRASTMENASIEGGMLSLECTPQACEEILTGWGGRLEIGAINSPHSLAVSGDAGAIQEFGHWAQQAGIAQRPLPVQYAFHSAMVEPVRQPLLERLDALRPGPARLPMVSTVTGQFVTGPELDADYWWRNVRQTVLFAPAIEQLLAQGHEVFLEVGPHPVLSANCVACADQIGRQIVTLSSARRGLDQQAHLLETLGQLWSLGAAIDWKALYPVGQRQDLPPYPWQRKTYRSASRDRQRELFASTPFPLLGRRRDHSLPSWSGVADGRIHPFLLDHHFDGKPLLSASTYIELALQAAAASLGRDGQALVLRDLRLGQACLLSTDSPVHLQTSVVPAEGSFCISALGPDENWQELAQGSFEGRRAQAPELPCWPIHEWTEVDAEFVDERARRWLFEYGPCFQTIRRGWVGPGQILCQLDWPESEEFLSHPGGLDAGIRSTLAIVDSSLLSRQAVSFPASLEELHFYAPPRGPTWIHCRLSAEGDREWNSELVVHGEQQVFMVLRGFRWKVLQTAGVRADDRLLALNWTQVQPADLAGPPRVSLRGPGAARLTAHVEPGRQCSLFVADESEPLDQLQALVEWLQECEQSGTSDPWVLVTFGAQAVAESSHISLQQAPLLGFWRALQLEHPRLQPRLIDLPHSPSDQDLHLFLQALGASQEPELAIRDGRLLAPHWSRTSMDRLERPLSHLSYAAQADRTGLIDDVIWRQRVLPPVGADEVLLRVEASGLNFSDVMKALGIYPDGSQNLGLECAGEVLEVGTQVDWPRPGDRVVALGASLLGSRALIKACLTAPWPAGLEAAQAASLPVVSVTAALALEQVARLTAGEKVLIHSATGGVGLAAVAVALRLGARVFGSAGTPEKRRFLREMGISHVYDSRSPDFAYEVLRDSGGQGLDVVLNSLAGQGLERSLECLGPLGRLVEIGKRDIYDNHALRLHPFRRSLSFLAFDLELWMKHRPQQVGQVLRRLMEGVQPLPTQSWPAGELHQALQALASAQHIGKMAVTHTGPIPASPSSQPAPQLDPQRSYLVSGGLSGFGAALAAWLVGLGARHLLLIGRRGLDTSGAPELLEQLGRAGARVVVQAADLASLEPEDFWLQDLPPLGGVFHAANHMEDTIAVRLDRSKLERVYAPKALGAWKLHRLTQQHPVEHFVLFSSISSSFGSAGQANYCAANAYLDALAHQRRRLGLSGLVVNWGPLGDVGYLTTHPQVLAQLQSQGHLPMRVGDCLEVLGRLMVLNPVQVAVALGDWERRDSLPQQDGPAQDQQPILDFLLQQGERILRLPSLAELVHRPLRELGLDSLLAVEFRNAIEKNFRVSLPIQQILRGPSIDEICREVERLLAGGLTESQDLPHLSDQEVEQMLRQMESRPGL